MMKILCLRSVLGCIIFVSLERDLREMSGVGVRVWERVKRGGCGVWGWSEWLKILGSGCLGKRGDEFWWGERFPNSSIFIKF